LRKGFLFRAYPTLMTEEATSGLMDSIFASSDVDMQGRLLKIIQDFLSTTSAKQTESEKGSGQQVHTIGVYGFKFFSSGTWRQVANSNGQYGRIYR
jgi:hypothetical protein